MSTAFKTEQETFWAGEFGDQYVGRNQGGQWIAANTALFAKALARTSGIRRVLELGANIGLNLHALQVLLPQADFSAVEINANAAEELRSHWNPENIFEQSILDFAPEQTYDLTFTKGVLIHINPNELANVYDCLFQASHRYVLMAEYYSPAPVEISYRGHQGKLFKRDFAGEFLQRHPSTRLIDYGFAYRNDPNFPQDDLTWFLIEKTSQ